MKTGMSPLAYYKSFSILTGLQKRVVDFAQGDFNSPLVEFAGGNGCLVKTKR